MLLFAEHISVRLRYVVDFISSAFFFQPIQITGNREEFLQSREPKINYSSTAITDNELWIKPAGLLSEEGIRPQIVECFGYSNYTVFFKTSGGDFTFDMFAGIFYLLSRYEEYLPSAKDENGMFSYKNSIAWQNNFLKTPLINYWLKDLRKKILQKFPDTYFRYTRFKFLPTYNIDQAYAYIKNGWKEETVSAIRAAVKGEWKIISERKAVFNGKKKDPFDAYEWLDALHLYCRLRPHFFFLLADQRNDYDNNISPTIPQYQQLIAYYAATFKVGIRLSYKSGKSESVVKEEIELLEYLADRKVIHSRQHFLAMSLPDTYRTLIKHGIEKDHSMGYPDINGFRASVASSFYWYDLENESATNLRIFPFCFADTNAYYKQKLKAEQAFEELMHFYNVIKPVNGLMITLWHNHFLGTDARFKGWREVYEIFLKDEVYWDG